jgi:protein-disulfide isomerase
METYENPSKLSPDDVIVLKKSHVLLGLLPIMFLLGLGLGYFLWGTRTVQPVIQTGESGRQPSAQAAPQQNAAAQPAPPTALPARIDVSVDDDPAFGPNDAAVTIVEFSDFECPFCGRFRVETFDALIEQYDGQIRFVYRDFPLSSIHPNAQKAAEAAECADEQGQFWEMHDLIFANQTNMGVSALSGFATELELDEEAFDECLNSGQYTEEVLADFQEGQAYGVTGTPTFFINGVRLVGAQPLSAFQAIIDQELEP